ncbi:hypothetical protein Poly41_56650 [Novipirellula artificiosorum]|uniref:3-keto-alpha-glucoside-1,2-lyase/3-keto-2-hydroxy-glucal hydratase domain-containing protein n=2 Tax=Novipirellula artificiosorum TaxID=2528016 RepID=A0A5C6D5Q0_9BACT|nr:hypothetical protein Poly41_56650 [Novipirellula artificiosorum]
MNGNRAVRTEKWKAVAREGLSKDSRYRVQIPIEIWELYDMQGHRTERNDVAAENPEVLRGLVGRWEQWIQTPARNHMPPNTLTPEEAELGFERLFNGVNFDGWKNPGSWKVENNAFAFATQGGGLVYRTKRIPDNFELRFDWKVAEGSNSGVTCRPGLYEYQILDNAGNGDGKNPRTSAASLYFCMAPSHDATKPVGLWNSSRMIYKDTVIQHWLNGQKVIDFNYSDPKWAANVELLRRGGGTDLTDRGAPLVLQNHGHPVWFRNIKLREIPESELLDTSPIKPTKIPPEALESEARILSWHEKHP